MDNSKNLLSNEIEGELIKKLPQEAGESKAGKPWVKQQIIIQTLNDFNNEVCITAFGEEKIKEMNKLEIGDQVKVLCNIYSKEFNDKYYNYIDGYWFCKKGKVVESNNEFVTPDPF